MEDTLKEAAIALQQSWDITLPDVISEQEIIKQLTQRVVRLLEGDAESFFQLMYRLDISEKKLTGVLDDENVAEKIAYLIYERQIQKIISRKEHKVSPQKGDEDLQW